MLLVEKGKTFQRTFIVNMQYKENSRDAGGQLTSNTVNRHSKKTFRVSSMSWLFSRLTIQESMGTLTGKRTFVEWLRLCNHSIILVRKKGGLSKALKVLHRSMESAFQKKFKERLMRHLKKKTCQPAGTYEDF